MPEPDPMRRMHVCREHQGPRQCRYLIAGKCLKHHIDAKSVIDFRVIKGTQTAFGDNCDGLKPPEPPTPAAPPPFLGFEF